MAEQHTIQQLQREFIRCQEKLIIIEQGDTGSLPSLLDSVTQLFNSVVPLQAQSLSYDPLSRNKVANLIENVKQMKRTVDGLHTKEMNLRYQRDREALLKQRRVCIDDLLFQNIL